MTAQKTTRKAAGKISPEPQGARIIRDLAACIERRGRERYTVKAENIRKRLMDVMESGWPSSADETLKKLAIDIINRAEPSDAAIFAEIREINSDIVPSERPRVKYPEQEFLL